MRNDEALKFPAMHICADSAAGHDFHEFVRRLAAGKLGDLV
jgi:hypothetical protein